MTVPSSRGIFGIGPQVGKGSLATSFYRFKAIDVALGTNEVQDRFPLTVGGTVQPEGQYKKYVFGGGNAIFQPPLQDAFGWVLYAATGSVTTSADTPEIGLSRHAFNPVDPESMKWVSLRKVVPGPSGTADNFGEVVQDARVAALAFRADAGEPLQVTATFVGREPSGSLTGVDAWTWANTFEAVTSIPLSHTITIKLPDFSADALKAIRADVVITNRTTRPVPGEEIVVGSQFPDDFVILEQTLSIALTLKWENPDLYQQILHNNQTEVGGIIPWSGEVRASDFEMISQSPGNIPGFTSPYRLRIYAPQVSLAVGDGPVRLQGGRFIVFQVVGTAMAQAAVSDYFTIELDNAVASYTWPT